jgi:hypothetical protein
MITLPNYPGPAEASFELIDFGGVQPGVLGGSDQRVNRLGGRWSMTVTLPPMRAALAEEWAADLTAALEEGAAMRVREPNAPLSPVATLLVAGAGQAGGTLAVDGGTPGAVLRKGKWFSILTGGRRYLHKLGAAVELDGTGAADLPIRPRLRVVPADNAVIEFAAPVIEGLLVTPPGWTIDRGRIERGITFTIRERK